MFTFFQDLKNLILLKCCSSSFGQRILFLFSSPLKDKRSREKTSHLHLLVLKWVSILLWIVGSLHILFTFFQDFWEKFIFAQICWAELLTKSFLTYNQLCLPNMRSTLIFNFLFCRKINRLGYVNIFLFWLSIDALWLIQL